MIDFEFSCSDALFAVPQAELKADRRLVQEAYWKTVNKAGAGSGFMGWLDLPVHSRENVQVWEAVEACAGRLAELAEVVVVVGIGGSYLGARAVIEALTPAFPHLRQPQRPAAVFAGNSISEDYLHDLLQVLDQKDYALIVVSKSGTTTEPAIAFRILKRHCEQKYGKEKARGRIVAVTDRAKGALKAMAGKEGYRTFVIPDDVGGRYSVLTPVGLLPVAAAGLDIRKLLQGAAEMRSRLLHNTEPEDNAAMQYALMRHLLYKQNRKIEMMVAFEPQLLSLIEWYKQLFGESEGKDGKGIFPAGAVFSTDLHSLGQYIQQGTPQLFETVIQVRNSRHRVPIPFDEENTDGLNYLRHRTITEINDIARRGVCMAHVAGKVPNMAVSIPAISETTVGELVYFFEFSCTVSGYLLGVNPFDQPGVEAYKRNMFRLLGKPGCES